MSVYLDLDNMSLEDLRNAKRNVVKQLRVYEENGNADGYNSLVDVYQQIVEQENYIKAFENPIDTKSFDLNDYKPLEFFKKG